MFNSPFGLVQSRSNDLVNSDLTESWWTCTLGGVVFLAHWDGPRVGLLGSTSMSLHNFIISLSLGEPVPKIEDNSRKIIIHDKWVQAQGLCAEPKCNYLKVGKLGELS